MQIVIPGALPETGVAREITPYLEKAAPALVQRFVQSRARVEHINLLETACTSFEYWVLQQHGFTPENTQNMSSGLGPLWHPSPTSPDQSIWLAELVHVSPARDGAGLLTAQQLSITPAQSLALFEAAKPLFDAPDTELIAISHDRWQIQLPPAITPASTSPTLVSNTRVNDWWPQDAASRPLRRLINELQMTWHDHAVNRERETQGLAPVNSLWVFGGARANQLVTPAQNFRTLPALQDSFSAQDWGRWLQAMATINDEVAQLGPDDTLVLLGEDRLVTLTPAGLAGRIARYFSRRTHWRHWWSPQNS